MFRVIVFLTLIVLNLFSITLNKTYYVDSNNIKLLNLAPDSKYDVTLYKIDANRYTKKVKSEKVVKLLNKHGLKNVESSSRYIKFVKKSPIDTSKIESYIITLYKSKYPDITINSLMVVPRGYIESLPKKYEVLTSKRSHLSKSGTLSIKTMDRKKIFFDYTLDAKVYIYLSNKKIYKGDKVSLLNTSKKKIQLDKFNALPITKKELNKTQIKYNTKQNKILTFRDVQLLNIIKKGSFVTAYLKDNSINISFSAKALQNGKLRDIITIQKMSGQKLKAKIIGKNRVEIR